MSKTKNKKTRRSIISLLLIAAFIITGIFAFMTARDSKTNVFTVGSVNIEVIEDNWDETDENSNGIPDAAENIIPGDLISKDPKISNIGDNDAYVFATVSIPTVKEENFYATEDGTVDIAGQTQKIVVRGYAFQKDCYDVTDDTANAAQTIWAEYLGDSAEEKVFGPEATGEDLTNREELFYMATGSIEDRDLSYDSTDPAHAWNSNWTQVGTVYKAADGNNYYTFLYVPSEGTRLDAGNTTDTIFDCVILNEDIGNSMP